MGRLRRTERHGLKQRRWIVNRVSLVNMVVLESQEAYLTIDLDLDLG